MPKFTIDPGQSTKLKESLIAMGMKEAFSQKADFRGISNPSNSADRLRIENVFHKSFVAMNEAGTEAAAASAVMMGRKGAAPGKPIELQLNRPFLFMIRDKETNTILFVGRVAHPKP